MNVVDFFEKHWKLLMIIPYIMLAVAAGILIYNQFAYGEFIPRAIELTGGKQIEIQLNSIPDIPTIQKVLPEASIQLVYGIKPTLIIEVSLQSNETDILTTLKSMGVSGDSSIRTIGPVLGDIFWKQTQLAIIVAFVLMSIVVFILFRSFAPSIAIIMAALTDILVALAVLSILGEKLSLAVLAGALMVIGYSVDTDIVLTTEVLKRREGNVSKHVRMAARTGLTMTIAAIAAILVMYLISGSIVIQEIASVILIGLIVDIPATWFGNVGILRMWIERKERKGLVT